MRRVDLSLQSPYWLLRTSPASWGWIAADAEGDADVADLRADVAVDGAGLFVGRGFAGGEVGDLGADVVVGLGAGAFEGAIPGADFLPGVEVGPGDVGEGGIVAWCRGSGLFSSLRRAFFFLPAVGLSWADCQR